MPARVVVRVLNGPLEGKVLVFDWPAHCLVGRSPACGLQLPEELRHVSRRHCLLEIDPPAVCVRDLGSLNGTFVNGTRIGRPERAAGAPFMTAGPRRELHAGDEVRLGLTVLRVEEAGHTEDEPSVTQRLAPRPRECNNCH